VADVSSTSNTAIGFCGGPATRVLTCWCSLLFFGRLAKLPSQGLLSGFLKFCALVPWTYFSYALQMYHQHRGGQPGHHHQSVFWRLILPISASLSGLVDFAIGFVCWLSSRLRMGITADAGGAVATLRCWRSLFHGAAWDCGLSAPVIALYGCAVRDSFPGAVLDVRRRRLAYPSTLVRKKCGGCTD